MKVCRTLFLALLFWTSTSWSQGIQCWEHGPDLCITAHSLGIWNCDTTADPGLLDRCYETVEVEFAICLERIYLICGPI